MKPAYEDRDVTAWLGDCRDVLATMPDASVDAVVTDPPYELGFMGKGWDASGIAYSVPMWGEVLRVLKPGGHLLAFGGTRTWHRMVCAIEDAGFEIRDCLQWVYAQGFPKSLDVSKAIDKAAGAERRVLSVIPRGERAGTSAGIMGNPVPRVDTITAPATPEAERWDGWGTALKPAHEPICLARKPLVGTVAANVLEHGTGALNVDGCRIGWGAEGDRSAARKAAGYSEAAKKAMGGVVASESTTGFSGDVVGSDASAGRWPANVLLDEAAAAMLDEQSGERPGMAVGTLRRGVTTGRSIGSEATYSSSSPQTVVAGYGDSGGASRFFYVAKAGTAERPKVDGIAHATVKPLELMRWLVRLVTPPGGLVLDPFAGTGTTAEACIVEGFRCVLIEKEADHLPLIEARLSKVIVPSLFGGGAE